MCLYMSYIECILLILEGIGLSMDKDYTNVKKYYPYLAQRLFTDKSPKTKRVLRAMLELAEEIINEEVDGGYMEKRSLSSGIALLKEAEFLVIDNHQLQTTKVLSSKKLIKVTDNFVSYTTTIAVINHNSASNSTPSCLEVFIPSPSLQGIHPPRYIYIFCSLIINYFFVNVFMKISLLHCF